MEDKLFTLLGLGVPFYLAAATYAVFSWLDNNASEEATKVISSWLHGRSHNKPDLGNLIINAFDSIYSSPLLTSRAFLRSAAISTIIWLLALFVPWVLHVHLTPWDDPRELINGAVYISAFRTVLSVSFLFVVLSDYVSLLFVRQFLDEALIRPITASIASSLLGLIVVAICFVALITTVVFGFFHVPIPPDMCTLVDYVEVLKYRLIPSALKVMAPALIIHLWLPLFALSSLAVRLVFWIFRAVEWAQWFLKQGDAHPLKAIGIVATIIVFGSAMLVKEAWTVL